MMLDFDGFTVESDILSEAELRLEAVHGRLTELFGPPDPTEGGPWPFELLRPWALAYLNRWRGQRRAALGLTEAMYLEAVNRLAQPDKPSGLDPGRRTTEEFAGWIIKSWGGIERRYRQAVNLVRQAQTVAEIQIILSRRVD